MMHGTGEEMKCSANRLMLNWTGKDGDVIEDMVLEIV